MKTGRLRQSVHCLLLILLSHLTQAQCPVNLDFESGNFQNWKCFTGTTSISGGQNVLNISEQPSPIVDRHTILNGSYGVDPYGGFPVLCPNGSGFSVKLGNSGTGKQAERISYEFTIPANQNNYSLTYQYAVVFQDPIHIPAEQPRFTAKVFDVATGAYISCASFEFIATSGIPGFIKSTIGNNVWYKSWSPVTINLSGHAGKTVRLEFTTSDCTRGVHFGYAYVDVNSNCTAPVTNSKFCSGDAAVTMNAPEGYQGYNWFNNNLSQNLGAGSSISIASPAHGDVYAVEVIPYPGFGCRDTLYTTLIASAPAIADAGSDITVCAGDQATITASNHSGHSYSWFPAGGLNNPGIHNPVAAVSATTDYVLTATNLSTGCKKTDTVSVVVHALPTGTINSSAAIICEGSTVSLSVSGGNSYQWFKDGNHTGANTPVFNVSAAGNYSVRLTDQNGCRNFAANSVSLQLAKKPIADFSFDSYCEGKPVSFINKSTGYDGAELRYTWKLNDKTSTVKDPVQTFSSGTYTIELAVAPQHCPSLVSNITKQISVEKSYKGMRYNPVNVVAGRSVALEARNIGEDYLWMPSSSLSNSNERQTRFTGTHEQTYYVKISSPSGCETVDTVSVYMFKEREIYVPKAFTPNNDGQNDKMYPFLVGIKELKVFRIMNRWGVVVYESKTDLPGWDGNYRGAQQPMDGYVWEALAIDIDGNNITRKGSFTLIR